MQGHELITSHSYTTYTLVAIALQNGCVCFILHQNLPAALSMRLLVFIGRHSYIFTTKYKLKYVD